MNKIKEIKFIADFHGNEFGHDSYIARINKNEFHFIISNYSESQSKLLKDNIEKYLGIDKKDIFEGMNPLGEWTFEINLDKFKINN